MTTITQLLDKKNINALDMPEAKSSVSVRFSLRQVSEAMWGISAFTLFLLLGPFSAIAAICGVISLAKQAAGPEPEAMS